MSKEEEMGYQILEPAELSNCIGTPASFVVAIALMRWLIAELLVEFGDELVGVEIDVVRVEYLGAYPALGVRYAESREDDVGPMLIDGISRILQTRNTISFVQFVEGSNTDWLAVMGTQKSCIGMGEADTETKAE